MFTITLCCCDDEIGDDAQITVNYSIGKQNKDNSKEVTFTATVTGIPHSEVEKILLNIRTDGMINFVATISEGKLNHSHTIELPTGTKGEYVATVFTNNGKNIRTEVKKFEIE